MEIEAIRKSFRPEWITTLFVGESAPHGGKFFYVGNSGMRTYMQRAIESVVGVECGIRRNADTDSSARRTAFR